MGEQAAWWLADGEAQRAATPWSFWIPARWRRTHLRRGVYAKVIFRFPPRPVERWGEPDGERMWVKVTERHERRYVGTLANDPVVLTELRFGDVVDFAPENVIAISWRARR